MGSSTVVIGDATTDKPLKTVSAPASQTPFISYPHGITVHNGIDRLLVTSTLRPSDMGVPGETVTVLEASSGKVLSTHKVSLKPSPSKAAPVEVMFSHGAEPPVAHITVMLEGTLWVGVWNPTSKDFAFQQVDDYSLRLFVTTAKPGHVNIYDNSDPQRPKFLQTIPAAAGAHHLVLSPDEHYLFVQNSLLNLPGMSDG